VLLLNGKCIVAEAFWKIKDVMSYPVIVINVAQPPPVLFFRAGHKVAEPQALERRGIETVKTWTMALAVRS
jgi:hypothetical protein